MQEANLTTQLEAIYASELDDLEKTTRSFGLITAKYLEQSGYEIELREVLSDRENLIKEQIKKSLLVHIREIYNHCHQRVTGRKAWDE
jgi:hypothetical protein